VRIKVNPIFEQKQLYNMLHWFFYCILLFPCSQWKVGKWGYFNLKQKPAV